MFQFTGFPPARLWIHRAVHEVCSCGFPHSEICGSQDICSLPQLIAAYHVFHRLSVPRHPPGALVRLTWSRPPAESAGISIHSVVCQVWFFNVAYCLQLLVVNNQNWFFQKIGLATSDVLTYLDIKINFCIRFSRNDPREWAVYPFPATAMQSFKTSMVMPADPINTLVTVRLQFLSLSLVSVCCLFL